MTQMYCPDCGCPLRPGAQVCPDCGCPLRPGTQVCPDCGCPVASTAPAAPASVSRTLEKGLTRLSGEKAGKNYITFGKLIKDGPKKRKLSDITTQLDDVFGRGSPQTTPRVSELHPENASVWAFWYVLIFFVLGTLALYVTCFIFQNDRLIPGITFFGAIGTPIACAILFYEVDLFRSIPLYRVLEYFMIAAMFSWLLMTIGYLFLPEDSKSLVYALMIGFIEEVAKALITIVFLIREKRAHYILDGLLVGAVVGASYGAFETMGYIMIYGYVAGSTTGMSMDYLALVRGLIAPGMHVAWTALVGGAFMAAKGLDEKTSWQYVSSPKFLFPLLLSIVIHGIWDYDLPLPMLVQCGLLTVVIWVILFHYINVGLRQIDEIKQQTPDGGVSCDRRL